jgi:hypothetical protein
MWVVPLLALALAVGCGAGGDPAADAADVAVCLPLPVGAELAVGPAGARAYEGCDADTVLVEVPGPAPVIAADEVRAVRDRHPNGTYLDVDGVVGVGVRRCCDGVDAYCVHLDVQTHTIDVAALVAQVERWFPPGGACLGVRVAWIGRLTPRCANDDPACVPEAYCPEAEGECCPAPVAYDDRAARAPLTDPAVDGLAAGDCSHDGDCFLDGCGQLCKAYTVPGELTTCACVAALAPGLCGCIDGRCAWFTQP